MITGASKINKQLDGEPIILRIRIRPGLHNLSRTRITHAGIRAQNDSFPVSRTHVPTVTSRLLIIRQKYPLTIHRPDSLPSPMADGAWMAHTQGNEAPVKTIKAITHARVQDVYGCVAIKMQPGHGSWYCWVGQLVSSTRTGVLCRRHSIRRQP